MNTDQTDTTPDLTNLMEWNRFAEERKTVLETLTIFNNRYREAIAELNQRLIERQESFTAQVVRIEQTWRDKVNAISKRAEAIRGLLVMSEKQRTEKDALIHDLRTAASYAVTHHNADGEGAIALLEKALSTPPPAVVPLEDVRPLVEALKLVSSTWTDKGLKDGETIRQVFHGEKTNVAHDALATFTAKHPL